MKLHITEEIDASVAEVWVVIADFGGLKNWHPGIVSCAVRGEGEGMVRTVFLDDGGVDERLKSIDPDHHTLCYAVISGVRAKLIGLNACIKLKEVAKKQTRIDWLSWTFPDHPYGAELKTTLAIYYPLRIQHLRAALERDSGSFLRS